MLAMLSLTRHVSQVCQYCFSMTTGRPTCRCSFQMMTDLYGGDTALNRSVAVVKRVARDRIVWVVAGWPWLVTATHSEARQVGFGSTPARASVSESDPSHPLVAKSQDVTDLKAYKRSINHGCCNSCSVHFLYTVYGWTFVVIRKRSYRFPQTVEEHVTCMDV